MGVTVEISLFGTEIKHHEKERHIFLEPKAWERLVECRNQIEQALLTGQEQQWMLEENPDVRAHVNKFKGNILLHIRNWWKDRPTRKGVSLNTQEWKKVKSHMVQNAEVALGIAVLSKLITTKLHNIIKSNCDGCDKDCPSQRDHPCLMDAETQANLYIEEAVADVQPTDFIAVLAQEAAEDKLTLEQPHYTFKHIKLCFMKAIRDEVLGNFE